MANKEDVLIGSRIKQRREQLGRERGGFTQADVAARLGELTSFSGNRVTYSKYELGYNAIAVSDLPSLSQVLECPIGYFFGEACASKVEEDEAMIYYKKMPRIMKPVARAVIKALYDVGASE